MEIVIAELTRIDEALAETMLRIQREAYAIEAELIGFDEIPTRFETVHNILNQPGTSFGAYSNERLIGFITFEAEQESVEIAKLCVRPKYFRRGVASRLLEAVSARHADKMVYVHTGKHNEPGVRLYERNGFVASGVFEPEPGVRLIRMIRHPEKT